jgi:Na+/H+-dicarboxylate symporter/ABC-type amino acid transport substrate-binding protein
MDTARVNVTSARPRWRPSLATQVLIGLALGAATGVFFGELAAPLGIIGQVFIGLLQMTVLPYIVVSLSAGLGRLSYAEAKTLALRGGGFILFFWAITLAAVVGIALSFPAWESATFFSPSLVEPEREFDFLKLYVPTNPFFSLANTIVPAIVVFSLALGVALIGAPGKAALLPALEAAESVLLRIAGAVARAAPIGVFALIAHAAGTMAVEALGRVQVYFLLYIGTALLLSLWVLPGLVAVLTPLSARRMLAHSQDALVTAFATGSLLIVIPLMAERSKELLGEVGLRTPATESAVNLMVPINFNLPNMGKLLSLVFVLFAGWFSGHAVPVDQYPLYLGAGLLSFFGEVVVALPFLLDLMRVPADLFQLFLPVDTVTGRFGTLLAAVHTITQALLTAAAVSSAIRWRLGALAGYGAVSLALALAVLVGSRLYFEHVVPQEYRAYQQLVRMELAINRAEVRVRDPERMEPLPQADASKRLAAVLARGTLRVGYLSEQLPWAFRNADGHLVGLDIDLVHLLAAELGVGLEFVNVAPAALAPLLDDGRLDIVVGGLAVTPERALRTRLTEPYMNATLAFVVRDHERRHFATVPLLRQAGALRVATVGLPHYDNLVRSMLPDVQLIPIKSPGEFFEAPEGWHDALLLSAEGGSAWTLLFPRFSVVVPRPNVVAVPIAFATPRSTPELHDYVSTWVALKRQDGVVRYLYDFWILGRGAQSTEPRWSVIRNVLGWVD